MKKSLFIALLVSLTFQVLAQKTEITPKITVQGNSSIKVNPDWVSVYMSIESKNADYNEVVKELNLKYNMLEKELVMAGFRKESIKTSHYNINKHMVWEDGRSKDNGYIGNQSLLIEFENDNRKITNLVNTISKGKVDVNFNFSFGLSDKKEEDTKKELINMAVKDASSKAGAIAGASSVMLKRILTINYGVPEINHPQPMYEARAMKADNSNSFGGFNAREIEMSDSITITWEIQ